MQVVDTNVNLTGQTASIPTTTAFYVNPGYCGLYAVWANVLVTSPGTAGSLTVGVEWSNGLLATGANTLTSAPIGLSGIGETGFLLGSFYSVASEPVAYNTNVTGAVGSPVYSLRLRFEFLG
jgi:hypothetical protein